MKKICNAMEKICRSAFLVPTKSAYLPQIFAWPPPPRYSYLFDVFETGRVRSYLTLSLFFIESPFTKKVGCQKCYSYLYSNLEFRRTAAAKVIALSFELHYVVKDIKSSFCDERFITLVSKEIEKRGHFRLRKILP